MLTDYCTVIKPTVRSLTTGRKKEEMTSFYSMDKFGSKQIRLFKTLFKILINKKFPKLRFFIKVMVCKFENCNKKWGHDCLKKDSHRNRRKKKEETFIDQPVARCSQYWLQYTWHMKHGINH